MPTARYKVVRKPPPKDPLPRWLARHVTYHPELCSEDGFPTEPLSESQGKVRYTLHRFLLSECVPEKLVGEIAHHGWNCVYVNKGEVSERVVRARRWLEEKSAVYAGWTELPSGRELWVVCHLGYDYGRRRPRQPTDDLTLDMIGFRPGDPRPGLKKPKNQTLAEDRWFWFLGELETRFEKTRRLAAKQQAVRPRPCPSHFKLT